MSFKKSSQLLVASSLLLTLVSCGSDNGSSSPRREVNPICSEVDCMSTIDWKIQLQGRAFPDKTRVDINGETVLNECVSKQKYAIDRSGETEVLRLENFYVPQRGALKMEIIDLGADCGSYTSVLANEDVDFEVQKTSGRSEIHINL